MKKRVLAVVMILSIFVCGIFVSAIADSGWDFDYDSGGSWGGSDGGYSGGRELITDSPLPGLLLFLILTILSWFWCIMEEKYQMRKADKSSHYLEYSNFISEELKKYPDFNKEEFLRQAFNTYIGVQKAWSEFDYDTLRRLTTDEMYNMYKMQLETLELKNQRNIMDDFCKKNIEITAINRINGVLTVTVNLTVLQKDYVIDCVTGKVLRGNKNTLAYVTYELTFVNNKGTDKVLTECPNCGAPIKDSSSQKCEYCNADLVGNATDNWVLAKKQNIRQGR